MKNKDVVVCQGGCHCRKIRFAVQVPRQCSVRRCNCSICTQTGFVHLIVEKADFQLVQGNKHLAEYRFNTGTARHLFCRHCGVKSFYVPRSHPEGFSINFNCLELHPDISVQISDFDGRNWSQSIGKLRDEEAG
jgi:hypothetical protein